MTKGQVWLDDLVTQFDDPLARAVLWLSGYSFLVWGVAYSFGMTVPPYNLPKGEEFTTYFALLNWWTYPFMFLATLPVLHLTWASFMKAWQDLARSGVLITAEGARPPEAAMTAVASSLENRRWWALVPAVIAALLVNVVDLRDDYGIAFGTASRAEQVDYACTARDAWSKWIWEDGEMVCNMELCSGITCASTDGGGRIEPPAGAAIFLVMTSAQQIALVFVIGVGMAQILLHALLFSGFERLVPAARTHGLRLRLNAASPLNEFGLERWNYALNNFYWFSCIALVSVFLSRIAIPAENYQPGQQMLGWIVPTLLLAPMVVTILTRQARLPEVWAAVDSEGDGAPTRESYARQQLWPLDRNWSSKLGIILAFLLAALALGYEMNRFMGLT